MTAKEFRKKINDHYRAAMEDCQVPTGALAQFNPAEFYAYTLYQRLYTLKKGLFEPGDLMETLFMKAWITAKDNDLHYDRAEWIMFEKYLKKAAKAMENEEL